MVRARRWLFYVWLGPLLWNSDAARGATGSVIRLPIVFHVATVEGKPVVPDGFVAERLARANEIYAPYGLQLAAIATHPLAAEHAALATRADRDALGAEAKRGAIDCFVVRSMLDVDVPGELRRGVHWHASDRPGVHFVIVTSIAGPNVLAHELGHYFGNPSHSQVDGNLMSYARTDTLPFLDARQAMRVARTVRAYLQSGELRAVKPGRW